MVRRVRKSKKAHVSESGNVFIGNLLIVISGKEKGPGPGKYRMKSLTGYDDHDFTKTREPRYTIACKNYAPDYVASPGPKYMTRDWTCCGHVFSPAWYMVFKPPDDGAFITPGANQYLAELCTDKVKVRNPAYSCRLRTRLRRKDSVPGPNHYDVKDFEEIPRWNAGMEFIYGFAIEGRREKGGPAEDLANTPGPAAYVKPPITLTKNREPHYDIVFKSEIKGQVIDPSPASYRNEDDQAIRKKIPAYTMRIRHSEYVTELILDADKEP